MELGDVYRVLGTTATKRTAHGICGMKMILAFLSNLMLRNGLGAFHHKAYMGHGRLIDFARSRPEALSGFRLALLLVRHVEQLA